MISTTVVIGRSPYSAAPPSLGPRVEPPCRVQWGWERNALGCGAAPTVGNQRKNSHSMDSNDPYLHLSKYASTIYLEHRPTVVLLAKLLHFVLTLRRVRFVSWRLLSSLRAVRESDRGL